jgi:2-polyprenyl-3-methyl-5-hydroxy-6-metoxy-1,4-benzoquinol methylase
MAVIKDPEGNGISALRALVDFKDQRVLDVGCGDGRLTWRYAGETAHVTAIDPDGEEIATAQANLPDPLKDRVHILQASLEDFAASFRGPKFNIVYFGWSL